MDSDLLQLMDFRVTENADLSHMARRVRLIAALTELPQKQREDLSKAVTLFCRHLLNLQIEGHVEFALTTEKSQHFLQISVTDRGTSDYGNPPAATEEPAIRQLRNVLDQFQLDGEIGHGSRVRMRQMLPPTFALPTRDEASLWRRMVQQRSLEDAIVVASRRARRVEADADMMRDRHSLRDELGHGTEDAESLLSLIASETDNFVVVMDADGSITWVNKAFVNMTGYSSEEINRRRLDELLGGPDSSRQVMQSFRNALTHGHRFNDELLLYRRDGRAYWTHFTLTPVRRGNKEVSRWIAIGTDVTQQRQAMDALAASKDAAEAASRAKSDFLANMSHEIRTPLNAIIGMTELSLGTELTREQRDYLGTVRLSAASLLELLNDVLDLSKIEAGRMVLEITDFNVADLLRDTVQALAVKAHSKGIELACHVPLDQPQWLQGDPVRLRQILVNLVGNAIKFTHTGEVVVDVETQWRNDTHISLHFCVRDTGVGIHQDKLEKIFESFQQADTSTTREYGGTGLGLTITSELLQLMGGRIWVESVPDEGSRFHFSLTFPLAKKRPAVQRADASDLKGRHALVVDDNSTNCRILEELLRGWQMKVTVVDSGPAAIENILRETAAGSPYDLVLLDAMMPVMDGFEVAAQIRDRSDLVCGTVMMLSSADQSDSRTRCNQLGIQSYVIKPVSPSALLDAILAATGTPPVSTETPSCDKPDGEPDRSLRILVADDHEANRQLAMAVLHKRRHRCIEAVNGREAVDAWVAANPPLDLILMDVQMPGMDGLAATSRIREQELKTGGHIPIVALTAHAMKGDREQCLAAGMDEYLAKPIKPNELVSICERLTIGESTTDTKRLDAVSSATSVDFTFALERLDGEADLLRAQMEYFLNDGPALVADIRAGIAQPDAAKIQRAAHRLKGLLAGYGRQESTDRAARLEQDAAIGALDHADELCEDIATDVQTLVTGIREYL